MKTPATVLALVCAVPALAADGSQLSPVALGRIDAHAHFFTEARPVLDLARPAEPHGRERLRGRPLRQGVRDRGAPAPHGPRLAEVEPRPPALDRDLRRRRLRRARLRARALAEVDRALAAGAHGVKVYKSLGMELRDARALPAARTTPPSSPVFAGLARAARPSTRTSPSRSRRGSRSTRRAPTTATTRTNPAWHVHGRPGVPSKEQILAGARPRAREAPDAEGGGLPPRQHGGGRRRDRRAARPLPELRRGHRGPGDPPDAAARATRCGRSSSATRTASSTAPTSASAPGQEPRGGRDAPRAASTRGTGRTSRRDGPIDVDGPQGRGARAARRRCCGRSSATTRCAGCRGSWIAVPR